MPPKKIVENSEEQLGSGVTTPVELPTDAASLAALITSLQKEVAILKKKDEVVNSRSPYGLKRVKDHVASLRFYGGKNNDFPVIAYGSEDHPKAYEVSVPNSKERKLLIDLVVETEKGKETIAAVELLEFLNEAPRYHCDILKQEAFEDYTHQGDMPMVVSKRAKDPVGARSANKPTEFSEEVALDYSFVTYKATIKFTDGPWKGEEMTVPSEALNH